MASTYSVLGQVNLTFLPNSSQTLYTVPAGKTAIVSSLKIYVEQTNQTSVQLVKSGDSPNINNYLIRDRIVGDKATSYGGFVLESGDSVVISISNTNTVLNAQLFGSEIDN